MCVWGGREVLLITEVSQDIKSHSLFMTQVSTFSFIKEAWERTKLNEPWRHKLLNSRILLATDRESIKTRPILCSAPCQKETTFLGIQLGRKGGGFCSMQYPTPRWGEGVGGNKKRDLFFLNQQSLKQNITSLTIHQQLIIVLKVFYYWKAIQID